MELSKDRSTAKFSDKSATPLVQAILMESVEVAVTRAAVGATMAAEAGELEAISSGVKIRPNRA